MDYIIAAVIQGIILGTIYGVIALGLNLIFGVVRVINFAHGSILALSGYIYYCLWKYFNLGPYLSMIIVVPLMFLFGFYCQQFMIQRLFERERTLVVEPISVLILTAGLAVALDNLMLLVFGPNFLSIKTALAEKYFELGLVVVQAPKIVALIVCVGLVVGLGIFLNKSEIGRVIRATGQNREAVALCGIEVYKIYAITVGIGCAIVSIAAGLIVPFYYVHPNIGTVFGIKSFLIVVLGGLGSMYGALVGGLIFGIVECVGAQFVTSTSASMLTFILFIVVLSLKPRGLMRK